MPKDLKGIHQYTETDTKPTFSELLNIGMQSVSDALAYFAGTSAKREALDPAPPGAFWQDTDNGEKLWSASPTGKWRRHEGTQTFTGATLSPDGVLYSRNVPVVLPTALAPDETILVTLIPTSVVASTWVTPFNLVRNENTTNVTIRQIATSATAQAFGIVWRVVKVAVA